VQHEARFDIEVLSRAWLERSLALQLPIAALMGVILLISALSEGTAALIGAAAAAGYAGAVWWARGQLRTGRVARASIIVCSGLLLVGLASTLLDPGSLPAPLMIILSAVAVALPALRAVALRRLIIVSWGAMVAAGLYHELLFHPEALLTEQVAAIAVLASSAGLVLRLLWLARMQVTALLSSAQEANEQLRCARDGLEAEVEARTAELRAREAELQRYQLLVGHGRDIILFIRRDGHIIEANDAAAHAYGYTRAELAVMQIADIRATADIDALEQQMAVADARGLLFETTHRRRDGSTFPVEVSSLGADIAGQRVLLSIVRDITERKQAEAALTEANTQLTLLMNQLRHSRDALRALFDGLDDALVLVDGEGQVVAVNQAMCVMVAREPSSVVGAAWAALCDPAKLDALAHLALHTARDGRPRRRRMTYADASGVQRVSDVQSLPLVGEQQAIIHVADVTDRLQMEAMAAESERFAAAGRLAAVVAHELNTPLLSIQSCLYMAAQTDDAARRGDYLELARDEIMRVGGILRQMLDLYRPSVGEPVPIDPNALVERVLLLTGSVLAEHGVTLERRLGADTPPFWGRPDQVTQVLLNIILNAVDAMPGGGSLVVRTGALDGGRAVQIDIADTGCGMPAEVQARVFEPFYTTKPHGSGLGLAICRKIVERHGGTLSLASRAGKGSTFTLMFASGEGPDEYEEGALYVDSDLAR
jgi:PAS domain S-box-containing protein